MTAMDCFVVSLLHKGAVIVRLDRTIQYAAAARFILRRLWNTGSSAGACHRAARCADPVADDDGWKVALSLIRPYKKNGPGEEAISLLVTS